MSKSLEAMPMDLANHSRASKPKVMRHPAGLPPEHRGGKSDMDIWHGSILARDSVEPELAELPPIHGCHDTCRFPAGINGFTQPSVLDLHFQGDLTDLHPIIPA